MAVARVSSVFTGFAWGSVEANFDVPVTGTLKGYDQLMNLVLDNVEEVTRGMHCKIQWI